MNRQQYRAVSYKFRERMQSITHAKDFEPGLQDDAQRLMALRDRADMLECRASMAASGVYTLRMRLTYCTPRRVLLRLYGAAI